MSPNLSNKGKVRKKIIYFKKRFAELEYYLSLRLVFTETFLLSSVG